MKKSKSHFKIYLIIGAVLISLITVGTALLSSLLTISGNTNIKENSWIIYFDNVRKSTDSVTSTHDAEITNYEKTRIDFNANLKEPGDFYEFTVYTVNDGSIDAMVDSVEKYNLTEDQLKYLDFTVTYDNGREIKRCDPLDAHTRKRIKAIVKFKDGLELNNYPTEGVSLDLYFNINYVQKDDACPEDPVGNEKLLTILPNGGSYKGRTDETRVYIEPGTPYTIEEPIRYLYNFDGWEVVSPEEGGTYTLNDNVITLGEEDVTIQAKWIEGAYVARIMNTYYPSIQEAFDHVDDGWDDNTVFLLKNQNEDPTNTAQDAFTFNLGGFKVTGQVTNPKEGNIRLINGKIQAEEDQTEAFINYGNLTMGTLGGGVQIENSIAIIGNEVGLRNVNKVGNYGQFFFYDGYIEAVAALVGGYTQQEPGYYIFSEHIPERNDQRVYLVRNPNRAIAKTETDGEIYYYNLQDAINQASINKAKAELTDDDYIISVVRNFEAAYKLSVKENETIIVDLDGHTVSTGDTITNEGNFTLKNTAQTAAKIKSSKAITNINTLNINNISISATADSNVITNSANLNLVKTTIQAKGGYGIDNSGDGTISLDENTYIYANEDSYGLNNTGNDLVIDNGNIYGIKNTKNLTLNNNVKVHIGESDYAIYNKSNIVMNNGEISDTSTKDLIYCDGGTFTMNDGTISNQKNAIRFYGGSATINGGTVTTIDSPVAHGSGTFTVNDGTVECENGIAVTSTSFIINGGSVTGVGKAANVTNFTMTGGTVTSNDVGVNANTSTISGGTVNGVNYGLTTKNIIMSAGNINATSGIGVLVDTNGTITGGTIFGDTYGINAKSALTLGTNEGTISSTNPIVIGNLYGLYIEGNDINFYDGILKGQTDGYYGKITGLPTGGLIVEGEEEINGNLYQTDFISAFKNWLQVGDEQFNNIDSACEAINGTGTITVIDDVDLRFIQHFNKAKINSEEIDRNITFDLNGHSIETTQPIYNHTNVNIVDSSLDKTGTITFTRVNGIVNQEGTLTIDAGNYISTNTNSAPIENRSQMIINYAHITGPESAIRNYNTLRINDILIDNTPKGIRAHAGTVTVYGGQITATNIGISKEDGSVVVNGGTIYGTNYGIGGSDGSATVNGGLVKSTENNALYTYYGTLRVTGGQVISENNIGMVSHSDMIVTGGYVEGTQGIQNEVYCTWSTCWYNDIDVTGGHIVGTVENGINSKGDSTGQLTITGGTIEGLTNGVTATAKTRIGNDNTTVSITTPELIGHTNYGLVHSNYTEFYDGILKGIVDGHYGLISIIPDAYMIKDDYEYIDKVEYQTDYLIEKGNWLKVGNQEFNSINKASRYITSENKTMTVIADAYVDFAQEIPSNKNVIFDFNGHSLITTQPIKISGTVQFINSQAVGGINNLRDYAIQVNSNGIATIEDGMYHSDTTSTIYNSGELIVNGGTIKADYQHAITNAGTLTINNVTIESSEQASGVGNTGTTTINGGNITSDKVKGITSSNGTVTINGGVITSNEGIAVAIESTTNNRPSLIVNNGEINGYTTGINHGEYKGSLTINNGHIVGQTVNGVITSATSYIYGGNIEGAQYGLYAQYGSTSTTIGRDNGTIDIDSPIIKGDLYGLYIANSSTVNFYDGIIKGITDRHSGVITSIAEHAQIFEDEEVINEQTYKTEYLVTETEIVINENTGVTYGNLQTAITQARTGHVLRLLTNVPLYYEINVVNNPNITLDMAGHTISTNKGWRVTVPFTMTNTSEEESTLKISTATNLITTTDTLTVNNITLKNTSSSDYVINNSGKLTVSGSNIECIDGIQSSNDLTLLNTNITATKNTISNTGKMTITGGTYTGTVYGLYSNSSKAVSIAYAVFNGVVYNGGNNTATISDSTINGNLQNNTSNLTVSRSNITTGRITNNGILTMNDSTFTATTTGYEYYYNQDVAMVNSGTATLNHTNVMINRDAAGKNSVAISNNGQLNITNDSKVYIGIDSSSYIYKAIHTNARGNTTISNSEIKATGGNTNYGIYIDSETAKVVLLTGSVIAENASNGYGAYVDKGTFEMGHYEGQGVTSDEVSTTNPLVYSYGKSRGIGVKKINGQFNFYDGIIRASKYSKPETTTNVEYQFEVTTYVENDTGFEYAVLEWMRDDYQGATVCLLNGVYYTSVQDAIDRTEAGDEITLLKSIEEDLVVPYDKNFKLNLNKHSITTELINNGTLNVYNGSLQSFENTTITNKGTLIMGENDGNVSSSNIRIISEATTIKNTGTLIVYDGYIEGEKAVDGKVNQVAQYARIRTEHDDQSEKKYVQSLSEEAIKSGETDLIITIDPNGGIYEDSKEEIEIFKKYQETYTLSTPTKQGCDFVGWELNEDALFDTTTNTITVDISDVTAKALWEVSENAVAKINDDYYLSLQSALDAAQEGDLVELFKNTTEDITNRSNVTLDLGGKTVNGAFVNQGELKVINGTIENPNGIGMINRKLLTMGENDGEIHEEDVKIIGTTIGLQQEARFRFYDGYIEGDIALYGKVDAVPQGYFLYNDHNSIKDCQRVYLIGNPANAVAVIENGGTQYFFSLQDAIDTATITGDEIYIVRNFEANYTITTRENTNIVINLSGYNITAGAQITNNGTLKIYDTSESRGTITTAKSIINNGTLTIDNVNITANTNSIDTITNNGILNTSNTLIKSNAGYSINTTGDLRIGTNTETQANTYSIYNNQDIPLTISTGQIDCINNAKELILDGDVRIETTKTNAYGIQFASGESKVTINNATIITGTRCIYSNVKSTTLIINDGYFKANNNQVILDDYNNFGDNYKSFFTINGGTFESSSTIIYTEATELNVNGGTFNNYGNSAGSYGISCYNSHCNIKNATFNSERASGIYIDNGSTTGIIENNHINVGHLNAYGIRLISGNHTIKDNVIKAERTSSYGIYIDSSCSTRETILENNIIETGNIGIYQNATCQNTVLNIKSGYTYGDTYGIQEEGQNSSLIIGTNDSSSITEPHIKGKVCALHKTGGSSTFYSGKLSGITCGFDNDFNNIKSGMEITTDTETNIDYQNSKTTSVTESTVNAESGKPKQGNGFAKITYLGETTGACEQNEETTFEFKEREEIFNTKCTGLYKLEVWGAQGGNYNTNASGGYGGYSKGEITLQAGEILYVNVGGAGTNSRASNNHVPGGYNGGGDANSVSSNTYISSGGGATHIATASGLLSTLENNKSSILIVAGGGGGSISTYGRGGSGGGYIGGKGIYSSETSYTSYYSTGGTQTAGGYFSDDSRYGRGSFGTGGTAASASTTFYGSGGGGGYYGGAASTRDVNGAGGGSGFTNNSRISNPEMVGYKVTETPANFVVNYLTEKQPFLRVGEEPFSSMIEAIAYIDDNLDGTGEITVIKDAELTETTVIPETDNITLNLNGKTLTVTQVITNNGTLTINDLSDDKGGILKNTLTQIIKSNKTLNISDVTIDNIGYTAITLTRDSAATTTINRSTIKGQIGLATTYYQTINISDSIFETTGNCMDITSRSNVINLTNNTFTSTNGYAINGSYGHNNQNYRNTLSIIGGTYTGKTYGVYTNCFETTINGSKFIVTSSNESHYAYYSPSFGNSLTITNLELVAENATGMYTTQNTTIDGIKVNAKHYGIRYPANGNTVTTTIKNADITAQNIGIYIEDYDGGNNKMNIESGTVYGKNIGIGQNSKSMELTIGNSEDAFQITDPVISSDGIGISHVKGKVNFYNGKVIGIENSYTNEFNKVRKGKKVYTYEEVDENDETIIKKVSYLTDSADFLQVGDDPENTYNTFEDAIASITGTSGVIKVLNDNLVYESITIPKNKTITINLNDKNVTLTQTITNEGTLIIQGGNDTSANNITNKDSEGIINKGTLTIDKIKINATSNAIRGTQGTNQITITNSNIRGANVIQLDVAQPLVIENTNLEGTSNGITTTAANQTITVTNCRIHASSDGIRQNGNTNTLNVSNTSITASTYGIYSYGTKSIINIVNGSSILGNDTGIYQNRNLAQGNQTEFTVTNSVVTGVNYGIYNRGSILTTTNSQISALAVSKDRYALMCDSYSTCNIGQDTTIKSQDASGIYINSNYPTTLTNVNVVLDGANVYGIYHHYGTLNIEGTTSIKTNGSQSYGLYQSTAESTTNMNNGEIYSKNIGVYLGCDNNNTKKFNLNHGSIVGEVYGISESCGYTTATIGNLNNEVSISDPVVEGGLLSVNKTTGILNFYSGLLKGYLKENSDTIDGVREGYEIFDDQDEVQLYIKSQKTYSTTDVSQTATANTAKVGNGYAKVTYEEYKEDTGYLNEIEINNIENSNSSNSVYDFEYTGDVQTLNITKTGRYKLEVWGAQGGYRTNVSNGGKGGYSTGIINLTSNTNLYVYVGGSGNTGGSSGGFNGGGRKSSYPGGGGASDIRINDDSLYARVIVAGGGGSDGATNKPGGFGGGLIGQSRTENYGSGATGGSQIESGTYRASFGLGGAGNAINGGNPGAGGGGWYGGGGANPDGGGDDDRGGAGGSGYVYTATSASDYPAGCLLNSNYYLTDAETIAGNNSFKTPDGAYETGHYGNGYARITYLGEITANDTYNVILTTKIGTISNPIIVYNANDVLGEIPSPTIDTTNYEFKGWYLDSKYQNKVTSTTTINSDTRLYAKVLPKSSYCSSFVGDTTEFDYVGNEQTMQIICPGKYKLEVWGAEGGSSQYDTYSNVGGKGGYTTGTVNLKTAQVLYINVGGKGNGVNYQKTAGTYTFDDNTGYNGGGYAVIHTNNSAHAGGGGATHIATTSGLLKNKYTNKNSILIVAGGGGGASTHKSYPSYSGDGGSGGGAVAGSGITSNSTCYNYGTGGTQTTIGSYQVCTTDGQNSRGETIPDAADFGLGSNYISNYVASGYSYSGGGGGYYGGQSGWHAPGGGGSGYISKTEVTDGTMYGYEIDEAYTENTSNIAYLVEKREFIVNLTTNERYMNLQEAIDDASNNDTLQFTASDFVSYNISIPSGKVITIDLNGYNLVTSKQITNNGNLTIVNNNQEAISKVTNNASITLFVNNQTLNLTNIKVDAYNGIDNASYSTLIASDVDLNCRYQGIINNGTMTLDGSYVYGQTYGIYSNSIRNETINNTSIESPSNAYYKYQNGITTMTSSRIVGQLNNSRTGQPLTITDSVINGLVRNSGTITLTNNDIIYTTTSANEVLISNNGILDLNDNTINYRYIGTSAGNNTQVAVQNNGTITSDGNSINITYDYNNSGTYTNRAKFLYAMQNYSLLTSNDDTFTINGGYTMYGVYNNSSNASTVKGATITNAHGITSYSIYNYDGTISFENTNIETSDSRYLYGIYIENGGTVTGKNLNINVHDSTTNSNSEPTYGAYINKGHFNYESGSLLVNSQKTVYGVYLNSINATYTQGVYDGRGTDGADVSITNPHITAIGGNTGIGVRMGDGTFNFYDGYITGSTSPRQSGDITSTTELNYQVTTEHDNETGYDYCILEYNK